MRTYRGRRRDVGDVVVTIFDNGRGPILLDPRLDLYNHSPNGFEWGYSGSGPAQLALAILADHLANHVEDVYAICDARGTDVIRTIAHVPLAVMKRFSLFDTLAVMLHQEFKARTIARIEQADNTFDLTDDDVSDAIAEMLEKREEGR
jgi:hypothetical protein